MEEISNIEVAVKLDEGGEEQLIPKESGFRNDDVEQKTATTRVVVGMLAPGACRWLRTYCRMSLSHLGMGSGVLLWPWCSVVSALLCLWAGAGVPLPGALALPSRHAVWWRQDAAGLLTKFQTVRSKFLGGVR
ncbi:hypothetical protein CRENBAI_012051 [Crenichthys baileyi]|uniref:Uncharacterized protein n=1 Tax=Crenichthys baileyi TaxID=28760 RepID=A0AAV9QT87_9TELE